MMKKITAAVLAAALCVSLAGCGTKAKEETASADTSAASAVQTKDTAPASEASGIDYMALVNKLNPLPEDWEEKVETVHMTNSIGDDVEVEKKAYDAYLELKAELEKEGVYVDLDSARRSVADQQRIMDEFTEEYGADYAAKTVAKPGFSEHHTGLALDLYLIVDGEDIVENEDMIRYTDIWDTIHEKLADHGFILRYLKDKEDITGYGYEPWHIRYLDNAETAKEITSKGITLEEYLGAAKTSNVTIDLGSSELFTQEELEEMVIQIKCKFAGFGCELRNIRYAGDEFNTQENIDRLNAKDKDAGYVKVAKFLTDFHTPEKGTAVFAPDKDMKDYNWWLAQDSEGEMQIADWGY